MNTSMNTSMKTPRRVLILGASGMLGHTMVRVLSQDTRYQVFGTLRTPTALNHFPPDMHQNILVGVDVEHTDGLLALFHRIRPDAVVNCIGLVKQLHHANDPLQAIPINALLPHRLARLCALMGARLVQISTDCVFSGRTGNYTECDEPDATDLYGRSKLLGEVHYPHALTLRTSIIGHELQSQHGLVEWFLSQTQCVEGYTRAIFSGLPTVELARVVRDFVLPHPKLHGLYHVASAPLSKYDLLQLIKAQYKKHIEIRPQDQYTINRALHAEKFHQATGYVAPPWPQLIQQLHAAWEATHQTSKGYTAE